MEKIRCGIGIAAHNEEANIGKLLDRVLAQEFYTVDLAEIVVISSGSTDDTENIVREYMAKDGRIRLLIQEKREGKVAAVNLFIREAGEKILVLCSADLWPEYDAIEKLVAPLADPDIGMTSCRPVPVNDPATFMGFAAHLLWDL
ncbi:MAG: glycosyltransferase, partial [Chloroflexota bacterium]